MENLQAWSSDRISNLPDELIVSILMCLPIQDAARTSVLASCWSDYWHNIPHLIFDRSFRNSMGNQQTDIVIGRIGEIVSAHRRPILKFSLSLPGLLSYPEINPVINQVLQSGVQEFTLHPPGYQHHTLPSELYFYPLLTRLSLHRCLFEPPPTFIGFPKLISLVLYDVHITSAALAYLISICPRLERLTFENSDMVEYVAIVAPKLEYICFKAPISSVCMLNAPLLKTLSLNLGLPLYIRFLVEGIFSDLIGLHSSLHAVENLHLDYHYLQGLPARFRTAFVRLEILKLSGISFEFSEVASTLALIGNCPNLRKVTIEAYHIRDANRAHVRRFYEEQGRLGFSFGKMKEIEIVSVAGAVAEMEFIKFVLATSPLLEKMSLVLDTMPILNRVKRILIELAQCPRLSRYAVIVFRDRTVNLM